MAIREIFGQAVIGSEKGEAFSSLSQINRSEINLASAYMPLLPQSMSYLRALDIEDRYIRAGIGRDSGYGRDIAHFRYSPKNGFVFNDGTEQELPEIEGREALVTDINERASLFSKVTKFENVSGFLRILTAAKDNLVWHLDNKTDKRGLQTLMGDMNTLWLPDQQLPKTLLVRTKYEDGSIGNKLHVPFDLVRKHAMQVEHHHMSIHKGDVHDNPLYHSAPGYNEELNMRPGIRALLTLDQA
jgi:hypothetical protein